MKPIKSNSFLALVIVFAGCGQKSDTNTNIYKDLDYEEICAEFDNYAFEQKALLDQIRAKYKSDKSFIAKFNQEQISWIQYQDKRLRSLYPNDWDNYYRKAYGIPTFNGCKCKELIRLSIIRNEDLKVYLEEPDSGQDNCPIKGRE